MNYIFQVYPTFLFLKIDKSLYLKIINIINLFKNRRIMKMRKFVQNKLWRDKALEMLQATGSIIQTKELDDAQFAAQLRVKLLEEALEVQTATTQEELMSEIGDVLEVLDTIMRLHNLSSQDIATMQQAKRELRGGFNDRIFVTVVEHVEGSFGANYCLQDPEKYPEILD